MSRKAEMKQTIGHDSTDNQTPLSATLRKPLRKAPGTRLGIFQDWREGSSGKAERRIGDRLRDGR
jgi:hypothetical protein